MIRATDIPRKFDSKLERDFWFHLAAALETGGIKSFGYQTMRFRIGGRFEGKQRAESFYTPDFVVRTPTDELVLYDTKGHTREAASVRMRACATLHPFRVVAAYKSKNGWEFEEVTP